jgi:hypothetical protein
MKAICDHASVWCKRDCPHRTKHTASFECQRNLCTVSGRPDHHLSGSPSGHLVECVEHPGRGKRQEAPNANA